MARKNRLLQTTMLVTLVIIFSKAVGFLREMVVAHYFGTQPENDAYVAAYALFYIPVLLLNSCITSTLVPMYTEARARRGLERADRFASNAINILALIALGVTVLMLLLAGPLVRLVYSGYEPWKAQLTAELVRVMVLTLAFNITSISLSSLLNAQEKYIAAQITGFPLSFAIICAAALFAARTACGRWPGACSRQHIADAGAGAVHARLVPLPPDRRFPRPPLPPSGGAGGAGGAVHGGERIKPHGGSVARLLRQSRRRVRALLRLQGHHAPDGRGHRAPDDDHVLAHEPHGGGR